MNPKTQLLNRFNLNLASFGLSPEQSKIVAAVSGGLDSMVLLDMFVASGYTPVVAHVNYALRGQDSDLDEALVTEYAGRRSLVLEVLRPSVKDFCRAHHYSVQEGARILRYTWLQNLCTLYGAQAYAVAHHQEDAAETILLKLVKANEPFVLHLLKPRDGKLVRPLHDFTREELRFWQQAQQLEYRDDLSNFSDDYQRNLVRNKIVPLLRQLNPNVTRVLTQKAKWYEIQYNAIEISYYNILYNILSTQTASKLSINISKLYYNNSTELADLFILLFCQHHCLSESVLRNVLSLDSSPKNIVRYNNFILEFNGELLSLTDTRVISDNPVEDQELQTIPPENPVRLGSITLKSILVEDPDALVLKQRALAYFDAEAVQGRVSFRKVQRGESYVPLGFRGSKEVRDVLRAGRIPVAERPRVKVLADEAGIIWCPTGRVAQRVAVTPQTRRIILVLEAKLGLT
jgi:tRNA(Ile)-lysidine synthase